MFPWMGGLPEIIQTSVLQSAQDSHKYSTTYLCRTLLKKSKSDEKINEADDGKSRATPKRGKGKPKAKSSRPAVSTKSRRSK